MNRLLLLGFIAIMTMGLMCGCVTSPTPEGQVSSPYEIGDRTQVDLVEVIVSLPLKGATQPYQNLHVCLAATINPVESTVYGPDTVINILRRIEARINARVVESLSSMKEQSLDDMPTIRVKAAQEAQAVVDEVMQRWQNGDKYEVKILVVSLYWTDASVGRTTTVHRWWW